MIWPHVLALAASIMATVGYVRDDTRTILFAIFVLVLGIYAKVQWP